ncbi:hypothetical protein, partial [Endozoicomonas sp. ONNA2]|uniref:hypothetical protein n=1 Tax=Endozoicomonas sp. ONNA2 TaxID=2828741 RepID=UPI002147C761
YGRYSRTASQELSFNKFPISVHPELVKGRATELRQARSSQAMKIGKLFPDSSSWPGYFINCPEITATLLQTLSAARDPKS